MIIGREGKNSQLFGFFWACMAWASLKTLIPAGYGHQCFFSVFPSSGTDSYDLGTDVLLPSAVAQCTHIRLQGDPSR